MLVDNRISVNDVTTQRCVISKKSGIFPKWEIHFGSVINLLGVLSGLKMRVS